jgi:solute:Na+ symporter, SSS family
MKLSVVDFAVILLYLLGMLLVGVWFSRRGSNTKEFTSANGALPGWVVGLSIFGTYVSSISFLANPGKAYASNWNPFVFSLSLPLAAYFATKYFIPMYRRLGHLSAYEHLEVRFGSWARYCAGLCYMLNQLGRMAAIMYLVALAVEPLTGWDVRLIIIGTGTLVTLYTMMGGIEAVIWTDAIQSVVLTVGLLLAIAIIAVGMPESPAQIMDIGASNSKFSLGSYSFDFTTSTVWVVFIYGLFINLTNFGIDQSYIQRYATAESEQAAKRSVWLGALLYVPISALLFFVGTALFAFYQAAPGKLPSDLAADQVFPHFIVHEFPLGVTGLLIASILAAAMSSVDSSLNSSATLIYEDWYKRRVNPEPTERQSMRVLYAATLAFGLAGTASAMAMIGAKSVLDVWWNIAGLSSGAMLGLFLLGMLSPAATQRAAWPATLAGIMTLAWLSLSKTQYWPEQLRGIANPLHDQMTVVIGAGVLLAVGVLFSARETLKPRSDP